MPNLLALTDSYNITDFDQWPRGTDAVYLYMESRGGPYGDLVFCGLQYYLQKYFTGQAFDLEDIKAFVEMARLHGYRPNEVGLSNLLWKHTGNLPLEIRAVPEGTLCRPGEPMTTIVSTDAEFSWLPTFIGETLLLKLWYPITVASKAFAVKQMLQPYYSLTSDSNFAINYAYHNFGDRGSSSVQSAAIGGFAHLTQFYGTDNFNSLFLTKKYYGDPCAGMSIPATKHATVTAWGRTDEYKMYSDFLEHHKGIPMIACVLDSYNVNEAIKAVTSGDMKTKIESEGYPIFVMRLDSGDPLRGVNDALDIMEQNKVSFKINSKGYKVFNKYRILWGDGITPATIDTILETIVERNYSAENVTFGSGGDLMQNLTRDTCKFAMKCSAVNRYGSWRDVYKDPIDDPSKKSKAGLVGFRDLPVVFSNGELQTWEDLNTIRRRCNGGN